MTARTRVLLLGYGVLHGPMIAEQILAGRHAFAQLGCSGSGVVPRVTAYGLAGLGDLVATATSEHSHHHQLGRRLARGETGVSVFPPKKPMR
ncbi:MAG: hypothetical protein AMXMBFR8_01200 [Nevskiales bacterium]